MTASIDGGLGADNIKFDYSGLLQGVLFLDADVGLALQGSELCG